MNGEFREILDNLPAAPLRSRLGPYAELIRELRRRQRPYREIVWVLATKCGVRVSQSTLHDFVQRYLEKKSPVPAASKSRSGTKSGIQQVEKRTTVAPSEVTERIGALRRKPATPPNESSAFEFDSSEPLRLKPEKI